MELCQMLEAWLRSGNMIYRADLHECTIAFPGARSEFKHTFSVKPKSTHSARSNWFHVKVCSRELNSPLLRHDVLLATLADFNRQASHSVFVYNGPEETYQFHYATQFYCDPAWETSRSSLVIKRAVVSIDKDYQAQALALVRQFASLTPRSSIAPELSSFDPSQLAAALRSAVSAAKYTVVGAGNPFRLLLTCSDLKYSVSVWSSAESVKAEFVANCAHLREDVARSFFPAIDLECQLEMSLLKAATEIRVAQFRSLEECQQSFVRELARGRATFEKLLKRLWLTFRYQLFVPRPSHSSTQGKPKNQARTLAAKSPEELLTCVRQSLYHDFAISPRLTLRADLLDRIENKYAGVDVALFRVPSSLMNLVQHETLHTRLELCHPYLASVLGVVKDSDNIFAVVEERFQTLEDFASRASDAEVRTVLSQVGEALVLLHSKGAMHLNLNPRTVQVAKVKGGVCAKLCQGLMMASGLLWAVLDPAYTLASVLETQRRLSLSQLSVTTLDGRADAHSYTALLHTYVRGLRVDEGLSVLELYSLV